MSSSPVNSLSRMAKTVLLSREVVELPTANDMNLSYSLGVMVPRLSCTEQRRVSTMIEKIGSELLMFNSSWDRQGPLTITQVKVLGFVPNTEKAQSDDDAYFQIETTELTCLPRTSWLTLVYSEGRRQIHRVSGDRSPTRDSAASALAGFCPRI
jgi:hypothetical protein